MRTLLNILVKELLQLRRDPKILPILFIAPVVQLTILGYAATTDMRRVELAVCDLDRSAAEPRARCRASPPRPTSAGRRRCDGQTSSTAWLDASRARIGLDHPGRVRAPTAPPAARPRSSWSPTAPTP